ncbi:uncharacterized protein LOC115749712 isoform X2 [Rhodamnia argentea]|uniref:Uncharacterized protein LOC115749712 isoform X2 n=1 Tax=Rhodamnia argentea TaxID=178133 RepID=A0A8B8Q7L9_9MYRT|nr:uncharacterized protein LOC115749712 isoform X2 [Rhodamnia argentea]
MPLPSCKKLASMDGCSSTFGSNSIVCENLISELGDTLGNVLHVEDSEAVVGTSKAEISRGVSVLKAKYEKCLVKCATFPLPREKLSPHLLSDESADEPESALRELFSEEHINNVYSRSISFPTSSELVSAMKGTREKLGASPGKLTVRWAPDVYDPPPTSVSHFLSRGTKQQKVPKKDKRNGKRGQKGKDFSRGTSGKDSSKRDKKKKHSRRPSGSSDRCFNKLDDNNCRLGIPDDMRQFDIGNPVPDSSCGSSFFKHSLTQVHYSAAEAL